jgi:DNA repair ATPase RecN
MLNDLERAVRAREILVTSREKHKQRLQEIKRKRNELLLQMTTCDDESIQYENLERQIDVLDQQEYELHAKLKKVLQAADKEINESITRIVQQRSRSDFHCHTASGNAPDHDDSAT